MIRGIYTGAAGMEALQSKMDVTANNLANVDKTAFKRDEVLLKSFPDMLIHRMNDDGVNWTPLGSFDVSPVVGKLGTGVEVNEVYTRFEQGAVKATKRDADLALNGKGFFMLQTDRGERLTRSGSFTLDRNGYLVNPQGFPLLGEKGPIQVNRNNFLVNELGEVYINGDIGSDPEDIYGRDANDFKNPILVDKIMLRDVEYPRNLLKDGDSFYATTPESGAPERMNEDKQPQVLQAFLETSNVNIVREMVDMIEVQRMYELNQKSISTHDNMLGTLINNVLR